MNSLFIWLEKKERNSLVFITFGGYCISKIHHCLNEKMLIVIDRHCFVGIQNDQKLHFHIHFLIFVQTGNYYADVSIKRNAQKIFLSKEMFLCTAQLWIISFKFKIALVGLCANIKVALNLVRFFQVYIRASTVVENHKKF